MLSLVSDVAAGYFRLLELDREREIARSSADTYQRTLDLFTQRYEGGKDTKLSTSRAEASLAASLATIARLDQAIIQQENAISELRRRAAAADRARESAHRAVVSRGAGGSDVRISCNAVPTSCGRSTT